SQDGSRRLDNPNDFVRLEIETALKRPRIRIIPVLVNNAAMPGGNELPSSIKALAYKHAALVRNDPDFEWDIKRLIHQIRPHRSRLTLALALMLLVASLAFAAFRLSDTPPTLDGLRAHLANLIASATPTLSAADFSNQGYTAYEAGDYQGAIAAFEQAI